VAVAGPQALAPVQGQPLKLSLEGEGRPYYTLTVGGVPRAAPAPKAHKLKLARAWVMEDGRKAPLSTPDEVKESPKVAKGDRVIVEIEVDAVEPLQNLVLVDLLPGGFEIENPRLVPAVENDENKDGEEAPSARLELREDRLVIIEPWVNPGPNAYRYTLRAVTPGEYTLPATVAEGMYEPDRQALLPTGKVRVTAR
jgi:alpha-2-macroglobulin